MGSEWPLVKIEDVCCLIVDCVNKTAPVSAKPTPFRMIRTTNVRNGRIDLADCKFVDEETYRRWTRRARLLTGDVILTREAPIGQVGWVPDQEGLFLGQRLMQYRADPEKLDHRYLLYSFLSPQLQHQFGSHEGSGSVVSHIRVGDCFKFELRLAPLPVQKKIGDVLETLDAKIDLNRRINQTLEAMAQANFKSWFVDFEPVRAKMEGRWQRGQSLPGLPAHLYDLFPDRLVESELGEIPEGWKYVPLRELATTISKGTTPSKAILEKATDPALIKFLKVRDITENGEVERTSLELVAKSIHEGPLKRSILERDDILFSIAGTIGRVALVDEDLNNSNCNQAIAFVRLENTNKFLPLCWLTLRSKETQDFVESKVVQGVQANASLATIGAIPVPTPIDNVLVAWNEFVHPLIQELRANQSQSRMIAQLRDTLLPKLISGELSVAHVNAVTEA